ncbi:MAG: lytic transglycosylase, partial [Acidobacteriia bacterium]|nr:lytic transglycosylase [Terriglobia bacterium]
MRDAPPAQVHDGRHLAPRLLILLIGLFPGLVAAGEVTTVDDARVFFSTGVRRLIVAAGLARARSAWPVIRTSASGSGVPEELLFGVAMCESAFNPFAASSAGADGVFQFTPDTGAAYGLRCRAERRRLATSAAAAARHLADLHSAFGSWELALAAYNCGAGRVSQALAQAGGTEWAVIRHALPRETREYVPRVQYVAAAIWPRYLAGERGDDKVRLLVAQPGDTLWRIARTESADLRVLRVLNGRLVHAGQEIAVPRADPSIANGPDRIPEAHESPRILPLNGPLTKVASGSGARRV